MITLKIDFKNGSSIESLESDGEVVRGKRSKLPYWYNDCDTCYDKEVVDEVLKPFCDIELSDTMKHFRRYPSEYIYLTSGKKIPLWKRVWIDKIYRLFNRKEK